MVRHPRTGEPLWFNHVHLFHPSNLDGEMRDALHRQLGAAALPRNVHFGDGAPIPDSDVVAVRRSYDAHALAFAWRAGDVLLLDNFLVVHGRHSFSGDRRILVSMSELVVLEGVADG
jgi:alpha-ketoglutarate-dependent taurine dioxygenase